MSGKGFNKDPLTFINLVRSNLRDRYRPGFPVFKELIQNADDAGAKSLEIALLPCLPGATHPLFQGPGLLVANDGPFREDNARAIRSFGLSNRGGESGTIGKFGLGLKSIFHLCEAFFFVALEDEAAVGWESPHPRRDVFNPWSSDGGEERELHRDWDVFESGDQALFLNLLRGLPEGRSWFSLWIPLRQQRHCDGGNGEVIGPIVGEFPGDESPTIHSLLGQDYEARVAALVPMLRNLDSIRVRRASTSGDELELVSEILLAPNSIRRHPWDELTEARKPLKLTGQVGLKVGAEKTFGAVYSGYEALYPHPNFDRIREMRAWPCRAVTTATGQSTNTPEKAEPHAAVYFTRVPAQGEGAGSLRTSWAVFLPINESQTLPCEGTWDYHLTLHGYFFVDAGRMHIERGASTLQGEDELAVRTSWNQSVLELVAMPLVIYAIEAFTADAKLTSSQVNGLTRALAQSDIFRNHRTEICRDFQWLCRLVNGAPHWTRVKATEAVYELPALPGSASFTIVDIFPNLGAVSGAHCVTMRDRASLRPAEADSTMWPELALLQLLEVDAAEIFEHQSRLRYFLDFLKGLGEERTWPRVVQKLTAIARDGLAHVPLAKLMKHKGLVKEFIELIPANRRFTLRVKDTPAGERLLAEILKLPLMALIIPQELAPDHDAPGAGQLPTDDAQHLLAHLAQEPDTNDEAGEGVDERTFVALQVVRLFKQAPEALGQVCGNLRLFRGRVAGANETKLFSLPELRALYEAHTLFTFGQDLSNTEGLSTELHGALFETTVVLLKADVAKELFGEGQITRCDAQACLRTLEGKPRLSPPESRTELLRRVLAEFGGWARPRRLEHRDPLRYLLHGTPERYEDPHSLLTASTAHSALVSVARQALEGLGRTWLLVPSVLADKVNNEDRQVLEILEIDRRRMAELVQEFGAERIDGTLLREDERDYLLEHVEDVALIRALPVHSVLGSLQLVAIDETTFLEGGFPLDAELLGSVTILATHPSLGERQRRLAEPISGPSAIGIVLRQEEPGRFWRTLVAAVEVSPKDALVQAELRQQLTKTAWLPLQEGGFVAPGSIIHLPGVDEEVARHLPEDSSVVSASGLSETLRSLNAISLILDLLAPASSDALNMLGRALEECEEMHIGAVEGSDDFVEIFLSAFRHASSEVMPARSFIERLAEATSRDACEQELLPYLKQELPKARQLKVFKFLAEQHKLETKSGTRKDIESVFNRYLADAVRRKDFKQLLQGMTLLNRAKNKAWKKPTELCLDAMGLDPEDLVQEEQAKILGGVLGSSAVTVSDGSETGAKVASATTIQEELSEAGGILREYFQVWGIQMSCREVIGGFICLLGDDEEVLELAKEYLGVATSIEKTRDLFGWRPYEEATAVGANETIHETMSKQRFIIEVVESDTVQAPNLIGELFEARLNSQPEHILVQTGGRRRPELTFSTHKLPYRIQELRLRRMPPHLDQTQRVGMLKATVRLILNKYYQGEAHNLDAAWERLAKSEQLEIEVVQSLLLQHAPMMLRNLGAKSYSPLMRLLDRWDDLRYRRAEEERNRQLGTESVRSGMGFAKLDEEIAETRAELGRLLNEDPEAQGAVMEAIRLKLQNYQYTARSIPFELFQNADDAMVERLEMQGHAANNRQVAPFVVSWDDSQLQFMHWGRAINQVWSENGDFRSRGFARDLEKMLILNYSDKGSAEGEAVTGKFGLGFKSTFLLSDAPQVMSGRLAFEIMGGMLPRHFSDPAIHQALKDRLDEMGSGAKDGTLIALPFGQGRRPSGGATDILREFRDLLPYLLVFSRRIKQCVLYSGSGFEDDLAWMASAVPETSRVAIGELPTFKGTAVGRPQVLLLANAMLLVCRGKGVQRLSSEVPSIWVTAPTQERANLGFALNAPFALDVGRVRISGVPGVHATQEAALGEELGKALDELFVAADADWEELRERLELSPQATLYDFWDSMWHILAETFEPGGASAQPNAAATLAYNILWGAENRGMARLLNHRAACPSGLVAPGYQVTVRPKAITHQAQGVLADESVFPLVAGWDTFARNWPQGTIVAALYGEVLVDRLSLEVPTPVELKDVLAAEIGSSRVVDAAKAKVLGKVVTAELLKRLREGGEHEREEHNRLRAWLDHLSFKGKDGRPRKGIELLEAQGGSKDSLEEIRRASFAPESSVLASEYQGVALAFFRVARGDMRAPAEKLAEWALAANNEPKQLAALKYLIEGELGSSVATHLRKALVGSWLEGLEQSPFQEKLTAQEWHQVLASLHLLSPVWRGHDLGAELEDDVDLDQDQWHPPHDPEVVLEAIAEWWTSEGATRLKEYDRKVFPNGQRPNLLLDPHEGHEGRLEWMKLFLLGACHSLGRSKPEQHRGFVQLCEQKGWLETFASESLDASAWLEVVETYLDRQVDNFEHYHWMRMLYTVSYQLSRWLPDYVEAFRMLDSLGADCSLEHAVSPRTSQFHQGGGVDAPSISQAMGMGAHFVVREMVRSGLLTEPEVYPLCFVPVRRVRHLFAMVGCRGLEDMGTPQLRSQAMYEFLCKHLGRKEATFGGAFDIPFYLIAHDERLLEHFGLTTTGVWL